MSETSIRGVLQDGDGGSAPFVGWLGLIGAVDALRQKAGPEPPPRPVRPPP
ncbi:MAG: hypothetical protein M3292_01040 [Actinomycetota bacterium]|nr:hypothetical protein [Actinomycetota bacterium]